MKISKLLKNTNKKDISDSEGKNDFRKYIRNFWITFISVFCFIILLFISTSYGLLGFMPTFEELENPKSNLASEIISADQVLLGKYYIENRSVVHHSELSPNLINALIATEDARFNKHSGIDFRSIFRVLVKNIVGGNRGAGGGSTITQQLAKNLFPRQENPSFFELVFRKFKEWIIAVKLERNYTKEEIIAMYLNTVDFGNQSFGIKSAAKTYFNKIPAKLATDESALLVGMLKAPSYFSPINHPDRAKARRNTVLSQMLKYNYINQKDYDTLSIKKVDMKKYRVQDQNEGAATYFREYLRGVMSEWCEKHKKTDGTSYNLYKDGLKIYTTINSKMQKYAENAVDEYIGKKLQAEFNNHWKGAKNAPYDYTMKQSDIKALWDLAMKRSDRYRNLKAAGLSDTLIRQNFNTPTHMMIFSWKGEHDTVMSPMDSIRYYKWFLQAGLMSVEPQTGYVRAYVGGINYKYFKYDHVCSGKRQVGSTFKPFLYTLAMQEGEFSPCSKVPNVPVSFDMPDGTTWTPKNSGDEKEGEMVTLKWALANSVNYISAYLMKRYSPEAVVKIAHKMGITTEILPVYSICLGTPDLGVYEMTGAFSTFANKGVHIDPIFVTRIEDKNGNILETFTPKMQEAISEETAYLMVMLLKGVVESGTGISIRYKYNLTNPIAGKTGTTQNQSDGWFMGITPYLVTGVWVGCEDRSVHFRSITLGQGAHMALPIWATYMQKVYADKSLGIKKDDFEKPAKELSVEVDCAKYEKEHKKNNKDIFKEGL
ncbi:MAG TPA: PBP1A family penicillin-binding protein [Bacteroidales bacterium]|nr:PBP1A family penicillin-binding protein [Bacteroidales bacterium]HPS16816.1 PBP1A family penicillin-binding protein [Bacteroidales bacterium]